MAGGRVATEPHWRRQGGTRQIEKSSHSSASVPGCSTDARLHCCELNQTIGSVHASQPFFPVVLLGADIQRVPPSSRPGHLCYLALSSLLRQEKLNVLFPIPIQQTGRRPGRVRLSCHRNPRHGPCLGCPHVFGHAGLGVGPGPVEARQWDSAVAKTLA